VFNDSMTAVTDASTKCLVASIGQLVLQSVLFLKFTQSHLD